MSKAGALIATGFGLAFCVGVEETLLSAMTVILA
jgi:hypothetical protein